MQSVQPQHLGAEELLRHVYMMGNENLPKEWVEALCTQLAKALDRESGDCDCDECEGVYERGFEDGFAQGVDHANDEELK